MDKDFLPINKWPEDERPREKLLKHGSQNLTNCELLAILLRTGINNKQSSRSAIDLARDVFLKYKSLNELFNVSAIELTEIKGIGIAKAS